MAVILQVKENQYQQAICTINSFIQKTVIGKCPPVNGRIALVIGRKYEKTNPW